MKPVANALKILQRHAHLQARQHAVGGLDIREGPELFEMPQKLPQFPAAVRTLLETAEQLRRPIEDITVRDVENYASGGVRNVNTAADSARLSS